MKEESTGRGVVSAHVGGHTPRAVGALPPPAMRTRCRGEPSCACGPAMTRALNLGKERSSVVTADCAYHSPQRFVAVDS